MNWIALAGSCLLLSLSVAVPAQQHFDVDTYLALKTVSEITVSADGQWVAYTATAKDMQTDNTEDSVWIQAVSGGEPLRMTAPGSNSNTPRWSPDGRYLAVLSDREDKTPQLWLLDRRGGDAQQLTAFRQGIDGFDWAPDSSKLLLQASDPGPDTGPDKPARKPPYVIDRLQFKEDHIGYLDRRRSHIYVLDMTNRTTRQITFGDYDDSEPAWSPDSQSIVFVSNRTAEPDLNRNTDLWLVYPDKDTRVPVQLTTTEIAEASPNWSPDGRTLVYTSTNPDALPIYAIPQLTLMDVATRKAAVNQALRETQVLQSKYTADGSAILAITEYHGEQNLVRIDAGSGAVQALIEGSNIVGEFDRSPDGSVYALVSQPKLPYELFALRDNAMTQLSFVNRTALQDIELADTEKHGYLSADQTALELFVSFPPGASSNKKYPGILYLHGGPQSQWSHRFDAETQLLAARGYVVIRPNPRGSFGYGQAFASAIVRDWGGIDYVDVMAAVDHAVAAGWLDADRMAVYGWSYGAILTNHVITKTNRFKAAISVAGEVLYAANYGHDQFQRWWEEEFGLPWQAENRAAYERLSPFYALGKVKTPTLVIGGEFDWVVPIQNSEQLYIALKRLGVATELVVYPEQGHDWPDVPSYEKDLYERYFVWLDRYLGPRATRR